MQRENLARHVEIIGRSRELQKQLEAIAAVATSDAPVSIRGETGTGKELVARSLHAQSSRAAATFLVQNCAAVPETLLESVLFGHRRGSFSGADANHIGIFEAAHGGTLFLDEIGDMSLRVQAAVLRAVDYGEVMRVGETAVRQVDVRIISATNHDMYSAIRAGRFREDLYYRLSTFEIVLPPLRRRRGDIPLLADYFLVQYRRRTGKPLSGVASCAMDLLGQYHWPGNVRQLAGEIERACTLTAAGHWIVADVLSDTVKDGLTIGDITAGPTQTTDLTSVLRDTEYRLVSDALRRTGWNRTHAAALLGISRQRLTYRMRRLGIDGGASE